MKQIITIALVLMAFSPRSQTRSYHSFPDSNAIWNIHYFQYCFSVLSTNQNYSLTFSDDTVINCRIYHKLVIPYIYNISDNCGTLSPGYQGAICQDSANKLVIFIPPGSHTEQLLYDFNMKVGDTVKGLLCFNENNPDTISSIDSVLVGSDYRKRWNINSFYNLAIIEGMGSTYGLIKPFSSSTMDMPEISIVCFSQEGNTLYPGTTTNCELINSIKDFQLSENNIRIYPNPTDNTIYIEVESKDIPAVIEIFDVCGHTEKQVFVSDKTTTIDISDLQKGLYLLKLNNSEITKTFRIIKK